MDTNATPAPLSFTFVPPVDDMHPDGSPDPYVGAYVMTARGPAEVLAVGLSIDGRPGIRIETPDGVTVAIPCCRTAPLVEGGVYVHANGAVVVEGWGAPHPSPIDDNPAWLFAGVLTFDPKGLNGQHYVVADGKGWIVWRGVDPIAVCRAVYMDMVI